jgi:hypothetical protein
MRRLRFGALTVLLSLCSLEGTASAEDGAVAVLPFQGSQATKVRQGVQRGLRAAEVQLVPLEEVNAVVKKTKGFAKQAAKLDASMLVRARVRLVEGRFIAETEVLNAKGKRVDRVRTKSSSVTRLASRIVSQLMETGLMPVAATASDVAQQPLAADAVPAAGAEPPTLPRLVVRPFTGVQSTKIRNAAVRGLRDEKVELFPNEQFVQRSGGLGADLRSDAGQATAAKALGVSALVDGDVSLEDGMWSAYLRLVDGKSASVISQHFYEASSSTGLAKAVEAKIGSDFRKDIEKLGVQAPPEVVIAPVPAVAAAPVAQAAKGKEEAKIEYKARPVKEKRPAAVDVEADFRLVHRNFTYNDDLRGDLREYTLKVGPGVGTKLQYFPGAHFTAGVGAQFGIDFAWDYLFKFDSKRADGETFPTGSQQFLVGLRWRYPTGRWEPFVVADYGVQKFEFGVSGPAVPGQDNTAGIPGVKYEFVRIGGGVRVGIGKKERFILAMDAAFRGVFSLGGIGTSLWFPQAKAGGMDAMLMLGYALPKGFEIRIGGDYRRYWLDLNPVPPDPPYVAGGALDQYWGASIGAAWRR